MATSTDGYVTCAKGHRLPIRRKAVPAATKAIKCPCKAFAPISGYMPTGVAIGTTAR